MMSSANAPIDNGTYAYYEVIEVSELPAGERLYLELDDKPIIIFNVDGEFFAIDDECTHDNGPLGDGELKDHRVTCPRHGAVFDIRTGKVLGLPAVKNVSSYPVRIVDGKVEIGVMIEE
jgi:3-phenylpropionate/trans-cinnamate dioxygenase ferredoxin subunit